MRMTKFAAAVLFAVLLPWVGVAASARAESETPKLQVGSRITVVGRAENGKLGPLLVAGQETFYIKGKDAWEPELLKQMLRVTGTLRQVELPVATQRNGEWSAGVTGPGKAYALEGIRWERVDPVAAQLEELKDPGRSETEKWDLCRQIQAQGLAAIPALVECVGDSTPVGKTPMTGGECVNLPATVTPPPQCRNPLRTETLGERCELLLYNILTPAYTSPYMSPVTSKQAPPRPFVISDWKKWWQQHRGESLDQLHREARAKIDEFWQHDHKASIPWE